VNKLIYILIISFFLSSCSLKDKSILWKNKEPETKPNIKKVFSQKKRTVTEFNKNFNLGISNIKLNKKVFNNNNNHGSQEYKGELKETAKYKFSKLDQLNSMDHNPIFLKDGIIFFDKKGSIIRYNKKNKILWKVNHYTKAEKKLNPKLNFVTDGENLLIADSISKYYSINLKTGELNWKKNNKYPFNSEIKKNRDKIFVIDYKNTLRCFKINNGSECWNLQTEDSFTLSGIKYSLIISNDMVVFSNSIGDITAVDEQTGLILWQLPTQSSNIVNETYNFKNSKLVFDGNSIYFSNNKNEFYSIDAKTGTTNWTNEINSTITPIIINNLIFTVSEEGYLYVIEKNEGNIIRISNLFTSYKEKIRKNLKPIGFAIGNLNLYLTNSNGDIIVADLNLGSILNKKKIGNNLISRPFIYNNSLFVVRNGSIIKYN
jgi:outer membrane protein assembly factor BamB